MDWCKVLVGLGLGERRVRLDVLGKDSGEGGMGTMEGGFLLGRLLGSAILASMEHVRLLGRVA